MARLAVAALLLLSACAPTASLVAPPGSSRVLLDVPHRTSRDRKGAPAALACVLSFWGRETAVEELYEELDRDSFHGSLSADLQKAARARGFSAELFDATLAQVRAQLDLGRPLLALIESGTPFWRSGRWLVLTGYDDARRELFAHEGRSRHRIVPYDVFFSRWESTRRAAILVRPATAQADAEPPPSAGPAGGPDAPHSSGMQR
jgi:ABC-type bacteriocin/lantibiotic exporter with double-glycine peptidase domain